MQRYVIYILNGLNNGGQNQQSEQHNTLINKILSKHKQNFSWTVYLFYPRILTILHILKKITISVNILYNEISEAHYTIFFLLILDLKQEKTQRIFYQNREEL